VRHPPPPPFAASAFTLLCRRHTPSSLRDKEAPKVWQAREQTVYDEYDTVTVSRPCLHLSLLITGQL
jgi:hypothetical protein